MLLSLFSLLEQLGKSPRTHHCNYFNNGLKSLRFIFDQLSGAPKVRAMELIAELEGEKRGVYGGALGYFGKLAS
jgi:hypothetical protein